MKFKFKPGFVRKIKDKMSGENIHIKIKSERSNENISKYISEKSSGK